MKKLYVLSVIIFILLNILSIYAQGEREKIADNVLRLHVVGESNSESDQSLKIKVRDEILLKYGKVLSSVKDKNEAIIRAQALKEEMIKAAEKVLRENGSEAEISLDIERCRFPLKVYGNIRLPGGKYDAVNIKIGEAKGENWWCVMYPPLCFEFCSEGKMTEESLDILKKSLGEKRFSLISEDSREVKIKFKLLELFSK